MKRNIFILIILSIVSFCVFAQDNVIDHELQKIINQKSDELIDVNIIFKSQMSSDYLSSLPHKSDGKEVRREIIINELHKFSEKSQQDVLSFIQAETRSGSVTDINTHWITNFINCKISRDVICQLASHPDIAMICYNHDMEIMSDVAYDAETRELQSDYEVAQHLAQVKADEVWDLGYTGKGVIVAVLDSGVNYEHEDLKDHLWNGNQYHGYNVVYPGYAPTDNGSHGTHCAGIVCGDGTSGKITGAAPDATLMCIKLYESGYGLSLDNFITGIEFAAENGADILSISQGYKNPSSYRATLREAFDNLLEMGIVAAVAAGNERQDLATLPAPNNVRTPGDIPPPWLSPDQTLQGGLSSVISVGAVDENNNIAGISSQGPVTWEGTDFNDYPYNNGASMGLIRPDICAPGTSIYSLDNENNSGYTVKAGTSMSAPCVAGIMALMLEKNPELTPADLCRIIETTATKITDKKSNDYGSGCIDALAAVQAVDFNTTNPYLSKYSFTKNFNTGSNQNLELTLINNGKGNTTGTINVSVITGDAYVTIVNGDASTDVTIASNETASFNFTVSVDASAPHNHCATLAVTAANGDSEWQFTIDLNVLNELLPPTDISAQAEDRNISLIWNATNNATSYNIYRDDKLLHNTTETSYLDENLEYSTLYSYTITSKRNEYESEHSQVVRIQTEDDPDNPSPTNVTADVNNDGVTITWTNNSGSKSSNIYRKDMSSNSETKIASDVNGNSYNDNDWNSLPDGIYQYGVSNNFAGNETIYQEGFENSMTVNNVSPSDNKWYYFNDGGNYDWVIAENFVSGAGANEKTFTPHLGNKAAFIKSFYNNLEYKTYLVSQQMDYTQHSGNTAVLSFYYITPHYATYTSDINLLKVMISTNGSYDANGNWTELWSSNQADVQEWTEAEVDLSAYIDAPFYIAFVNHANFGYCTGIDEVSVNVEGGNVESRIEWSEDVRKGDALNKQSSTDINNFVYQCDNELILNIEGAIQIIDVMGRLVYSHDVTSDNARIDISDFKKSTYIVRYVNDDKIMTQKVVIL